MISSILVLAIGLKNTVVKKSFPCRISTSLNSELHCSILDLLSGIICIIYIWLENNIYLCKHCSIPWDIYVLSNNGNCCYSSQHIILKLIFILHS